MGGKLTFTPVEAIVQIKDGERGSRRSEIQYTGPTKGTAGVEMC